MNNKQLLDDILTMIGSIGDNRQVLEKIHKYLESEITNTETEGVGFIIEESIVIPEKYKPVISKIAESIDCGFICHVNNDTLQYIEEPNDEYGALDTEELDEFTKPLDEWEKYITIGPMESEEFFHIMEQFAKIVPDINFREKLQYKISRKKSFRNLKDMVENSAFREKWSEFKHLKLMEYVYNILQSGNLIKNDELKNDN